MQLNLVLCVLLAPLQAAVAQTGACQSIPNLTAGWSGSGCDWSLKSSCCKSDCSKISSESDYATCSKWSACCWNSSAKSTSTWNTNSGATCSWDGQALNQYGAVVGAGVTASIIIGILFIILIALPLCCGVGAKMLKDTGGALCGVSALVIIVGILTMMIPLFGSMGACPAVVDDICKSCNPTCTTKVKDDMNAACNALGFIIVYTLFCGWTGIVFGIVVCSLGICAACKCCALKDEEGGVVLTGAPNAVVVGTAVKGGSE
eukprot:TRINITY_DN2837_c0_g1_i1.p1 TRINITY_DN2837_c0_g1~~TRINITY_DN2837_c0_g1_i1.p1  ORF type:complete len:261 (+),score=41.68 TRINITY_DN2837_c0_g1_i1:78-860(+)